MIFGRLVNGVLEYAPAATQITFSNLEMLLSENKTIREVLGYKEIVFDDEPQYDINKQYLTESYIEDGGVIQIKAVINDLEGIDNVE